jgi:hypothetical protein
MAAVAMAADVMLAVAMLAVAMLAVAMAAGVMAAGVMAAGVMAAGVMAGPCGGRARHAAVRLLQPALVIAMRSIDGSRSRVRREADATAAIWRAEAGAGARVAAGAAARCAAASAEVEPGSQRGARRERLNARCTRQRAGAERTQASHPCSPALLGVDR